VALRGTSFGLTSGVLTTLGLIVGLNSGTSSRSAVAAGVLTIAIADAASDAFGAHIADESAGAGRLSPWVSALATFVAKLVFAATFLVPVLLLSLATAVVVSIAWGLFLLVALSYYLARRNRQDPWKVIGEHAAIAAVVLLFSQLAGDLVSALDL